MNISELINQLVEVRRQRTDLAANDKKLVAQASVLEKDIMHAMTEAGTFRAASDTGHTINMQKKTHPAVDDWAAFYAFITETGSFDLLQRRLSSTAFKDRWAAGQAIPGITSAEVWELSINSSHK